MILELISIMISIPVLIDTIKRQRHMNAIRREDREKMLSDIEILRKKFIREFNKQNAGWYIIETRTKCGIFREYRDDSTH